MGIVIWFSLILLASHQVHCIFIAKHPHQEMFMGVIFSEEKLENRFIIIACLNGNQQWGVKCNLQCLQWCKGVNLVDRSTSSKNKVWQNSSSSSFRFAVADKMRFDMEQLSSLYLPCNYLHENWSEMNDKIQFMKLTVTSFSYFTSTKMSLVHTTRAPQLRTPCLKEGSWDL